MTGTPIDGLVEMQNFLSPVFTIMTLVSFLAAAGFFLSGMMELCVKMLMAAVGAAVGAGAVGISDSVLNAGRVAANAVTDVISFMTSGGF